jgi:hypothetical protein
MERYKAAIRLDRMRKWDLEYTETEWLDLEYTEELTETVQIDHFEPFLNLIRWQVTTTDLFVTKTEYEAAIPGLIPDSKDRLKLNIEVFPKKANIV